mgnify:CR=1 FL=1
MRNQTDTSRFAYEKIMRPGGRDNIWKKIILCLEWKMEATNYEIAAWMKVKPEKVWKRTGPNELSCPINGAIFDTGKRGVSPEGNPCIVYALSSRRSEYANVKPPERFNPDESHVADYANVLIAKGENSKREKENIITQRLEQTELF